MTGYFDPSISDYRFGAFSLSDSRKAYFSFHFDDLVRVNDVRRTWNIDRVAEPRHHDRGFDSAGGEPLRGLIRDAVVDASAVCVLIGTETWASSRVRFEIARAVADKRGLLGVHLNNIDHHLTRLPHPLGDNPFKYLGVGKIKTEASQMAQYFLFEKTRGGWVRYQDFTDPVSLPGYLSEPTFGRVIPLAAGLSLYDFIRDEGSKNLNAWIDHAALTVRRHDGQD